LSGIIRVRGTLLSDMLARTRYEKSDCRRLRGACHERPDCNPAKQRRCEFSPPDCHVILCGRHAHPTEQGYHASLARSAAIPVSGYPPILSVKADIPAQPLRARTRREQVQQPAFAEARPARSLRPQERAVSVALLRPSARAAYSRASCLTPRGQLRAIQRPCNQIRQYGWRPGTVSKSTRT
jgi:hypothetical protein